MLEAIKQGGLVAVAGVVAWFATELLPPHPGIEQVVKAVGTIACIGGSALGIAATGLRGSKLLVLVGLSVLVGAASIVGFNQVAKGPPGEAAAYGLYGLSVLVFLPFGVLIQLAGLTAGSNTSD